MSIRLDLAGVFIAHQSGPGRVGGLRRPIGPQPYTGILREFGNWQAEAGEGKTRTVEPSKGESFGFLGFAFRRIRSRAGRSMPLKQSAIKKAGPAAIQAQGHLPAVWVPTYGGGDRGRQSDAKGLGQWPRARQLESILFGNPRLDRRSSDIT